MRRIRYRTPLALTIVSALAIGAPVAAQDDEMSIDGQEIVVSYMQSGTCDAAANDLAGPFSDATGASVEIVA